MSVLIILGSVLAYITGALLSYRSSWVRTETEKLRSPVPSGNDVQHKRMCNLAKRNGEYVYTEWYQDKGCDHNCAYPFLNGATVHFAEGALWPILLLYRVIKVPLVKIVHPAIRLPDYEKIGELEKEISV